MCPQVSGVYTDIKFDQLKTIEGGLMTFDNFLSTNRTRKVALKFARNTSKRFNLIGALSAIEINPSISTTSFARVAELSYRAAEDEILLSMHSVFHIASAQQIEGEDNVWQVNLTSNSDTDPNLQRLMTTMKDEASQVDGWFQLHLAQFDKTQVIYNIILDQTVMENIRTSVYHQFGLIEYYRGSLLLLTATSVQCMEI